MKVLKKFIIYFGLSSIAIFSGIMFSRVLTLHFTTPALGHADYPYYNTLQEAFDKSDIVVTGKIVNVEDKQILENVILDSNSARYYTYEGTQDSEDTIIDEKFIKYKDITESNLAIQSAEEDENISLDELQNIKRDIRDRSVTYDVYSVEVTKTIKGDFKVKDTIQVKQLSYEEVARTEGKMEIGEEFYFFLVDYSDINPSIPASLINPTQGKISIKDGLVAGWDRSYNHDIEAEFPSELKNGKIETYKFNEFLLNDFNEKD